MTQQERQLVAALAGNGQRRWLEGMEFGVVWAEVRRDGKRGGVVVAKGKKGKVTKKGEGKKWW